MRHLSFAFLIILFAVAVSAAIPRREGLGKYAAQSDHKIWDLLHSTVQFVGKPDILRPVLEQHNATESAMFEQFFHKLLTTHEDFDYDSHVSMIDNLKARREGMYSKKKGEELSDREKRYYDAFSDDVESSNAYPYTYESYGQSYDSDAKPDYLGGDYVKPYTPSIRAQWRDMDDDYCSDDLSTSGSLIAVSTLSYVASVTTTIADTVCKAFPECIVLIPILIEIPLPAVIPCAIKTAAELILEVLEFAKDMNDYCTGYRPALRSKATYLLSAEQYGLMTNLARWQIEESLFLQIRDPLLILGTAADTTGRLDYVQSIVSDFQSIFSAYATDTSAQDQGDIYKSDGDNNVDFNKWQKAYLQYVQQYQYTYSSLGQFQS